MRYAYAISYKIDGEWQLDGEWFKTKDGALSQARANRKAFDWPWRIARITLPRSWFRKPARRKERGR